jgi:hypothetical protein
MKLPIGGNDLAHMMMNGGNHSQLMNAGENDNKYGGGGNINNGGKNEGGMTEDKNGNKNVGGGTNAEVPNNNGDKKVNEMIENGIQDMMNNKFPNMVGQGHHKCLISGSAPDHHHHPNMLSMGSNMSGIPMGGALTTNMSMMNQMGGNMSTVHDHFASAVTGSGGSGVGGGYGGPEMLMGGNPYPQQQNIAAMMNQQRGIPSGGVNERFQFQPMMYAKPPMAANYMYLPPYSYPPPPQYHQDPYSNPFNDENTSSCTIM